MTYDQVVKQIDRLNLDQKILLVEAIWDQIAESPEQVPVPDFHKRILKDRVNDSDGDAWSDLRKDHGLR